MHSYLTNARYARGYRIRVNYRAVDGFQKSCLFKTVAGARRFAVKYVGENAEFGIGQAVSRDGVGTVTVSGCTLAELFGRQEGER